MSCPHPRAEVIEDHHTGDFICEKRGVVVGPTYDNEPPKFTKPARSDDEDDDDHDDWIQIRKNSIVNRKNRNKQHKKPKQK